MKVEEPHLFTSELNTRSPSSVPTVEHNPASGSIHGPLPLPTVYKYIRNRAGIVGAVTNPAGVTSNITEDIVASLGEPRAGYLDSHGFGPDEIAYIVDAFRRATSVRDFTALAAGCGMAFMELEWFWGLPSIES